MRGPKLLMATVVICMVATAMYVVASTRQVAQAYEGPEGRRSTHVRHIHGAIRQAERSMGAPHGISSH